MMDMKRLSIVTSLFLMFAPLVVFGEHGTQLPTLPCGELLNSEVSTNVALNVDYGRLENLTFSLELNASASNSLSIAVGTAAGDSLALDDADFGSQRIIVAFAPTTGSKGIFAGYLGTGDSHFMVTAAENVFPNSTVSAQDTENWHHVASTFDGRRILLHVSGPTQTGLTLIVK